MIVHITRCDPDHDPENPDFIPCCWGSEINGLLGCTCWASEYDQDQQPAQPLPPEGPQTRPGKCADCACRYDSIERISYRDGTAVRSPFASSWEGVLDLAGKGKPFYCHDGMRKLLRKHHPNGAVKEEGEHSYSPPIPADGVPRKADGSAAFLCAGWAAIRDALQRGEDP